MGTPLSQRLKGGLPFLFFVAAGGYCHVAYQNIIYALVNPGIIS